MALYKSAQVITVENPAEVNPLVHLDDGNFEKNEVVIFEDMPSEEDVVELYSPKEHEVELKLPQIPGAPEDAQVMEVSLDDKLEVTDKEKTKSDKSDKNDVMEVRDPWDWKASPNFVEWVTTKLNHVPKHSGRDIPGLERAIAFLKKIRNIVSDAMRNDLDGKLDASSIEKVCAEIEDGIDRLEERLSAVEDTKSKKKKGQLNQGLTKEARQDRIGGIIITVPLLISRLAKVCINGMVSSGKDITKTFDYVVGEYSLNKREQLELMELLQNMGYAQPLRDRGLPRDAEIDYRSSDNPELAANYPA